jgi:hypothetical protein
MCNMCINNTSLKIKGQNSKIRTFKRHWRVFVHTTTCLLHGKEKNTKTTWTAGFEPARAEPT